MEVARHTASWQTRTAVALTATCIMTVCANSQDAAKNRAFFPINERLTTAVGAEGAAVSEISKTRWTAPTDEYVLGEDGALKQLPSAERFARSTKQFGNSDSFRSSQTRTDYYPILDYPKSEERTSDSIAVVRDDAIVPECGPSPVEPIGIKTMVQQAAIRHGVDPGFAVAIVANESNFDRDRNSPKGARGPMQLMPATAERFDVDEVCDPVANIDGGVRYLRTLLDEFGNPLLAAAAYNAGEHRIYEYGGIPPFAETVSYVAKVVNHQLGLPMPSARKAGVPRAVRDVTGEVGVIAPKKTGSFVAGVMHF